MCRVRQYCHSPKGKVKVKVKAKANKVTVGTWAIRCMVSRVHNTGGGREAWAVATTSLEDRTIKLVATEPTVLVIAQDFMETATAVDGGPTMGTKF